MGEKLKFIDLVDRASKAASESHSHEPAEMQELQGLLREIAETVSGLSDLNDAMREQTREAAESASSLVETLLQSESEDMKDSMDAVTRTIDTIKRLAEEIDSADESRPTAKTQPESSPQTKTPESRAAEASGAASGKNAPEISDTADEADSEEETEPSAEELAEGQMVISAPAEEHGSSNPKMDAGEQPEPEADAQAEPVGTEEKSQEESNAPEAAAPAEQKDIEEPEAAAGAAEAVQTVSAAPAQTAQPEPEAQDRQLDEDDLELVKDFITEAAEHTENAEAGLLEVESRPDDSEAINLIFRGFHTVKGMAGFLNLVDIGSLAHAAENLLDLGRKGQIQLVGPNMDVIFESVDMLKQMMATLQQAVEGDGIVAHNDDLPALLMKLKACVEGGGDSGASAKTAPAEPQKADETAGDDTKADPAPEKNAPEEPLAVSDKIEAAEDVEPERVQPADLTDPAPEPSAKAPEPAPESPKAEIKQEKSPEISAPVEMKKQTDAAPEAKSEPAPAPSAQPAKPATAASAQRPKPVASDEKIKVSTQRLDELVNMVGELVIAQSMVAQGIRNNDQIQTQDHTLLAKINHQGKIVRELQELSMMMRMVPIQGVFQKMARLVRDLSQKSGKKVDFMTEGEETELDRIVVDQIADPLVHMIRNSVDHGIEPNEERIAAGKPANGLVKLRAFHQAGNIVIEIIDNGRGLNKEKIVKKAIQNGIISENAELSEQEIFKLIFHAGFSTADKVTEVSGRGVGMDVVKKNIESLRGKVDIESALGKGTTFTIRLPLTMAIIDGQVVRIGSQRYIIPIVSIECCVRPNESQISTVAGRGEMAMVHGELVPMVRLYKLFGVNPDTENACESSLVVVEEDGKKGSLVVDELLGQQQVVIKSLGGLGRVKGISGGAIMGDGRVSLIIDVPGLLESAWEKKSCVQSCF